MNLHEADSWVGTGTSLLASSCAACCLLLRCSSCSIDRWVKHNITSDDSQMALVRRTYARKYARTHALTYTRTHARTHARRHACTRERTHQRTSAPTHQRTRTNQTAYMIVTRRSKCGSLPTKDLPSDHVPIACELAWAAPATLGRGTRLLVWRLCA